MIIEGIGNDNVISNSFNVVLYTSLKILEEEHILLFRRSFMTA